MFVFNSLPFLLILQMSFPPTVVSPLWVEDSITQGRRLIENRYMVARPKEQILAATPASGASSGAIKKRKARSTGPAPPKPAENFDLDPTDFLFSSTQQLNNATEGGVGTDPAAPLSGTKRHTKLRNLRASARHAQHENTAAAGVEKSPLLPLRAGTATQAVADILAIDLPGENDEQEWSGGDSDLDTPLSERYARRRSGNRALHLDAEEKKSKGTSRLAQASSPGRGAEAAGIGAAKHGQHEHEALGAREDGSDHTMQSYGEIQTAEDHSGPSSEEEAAQAAAAAVGIASRFSLRNLHPERPLKLHKGTPLVPIQPVVTQRAHGRVGSIPIPEATRVASPWNEPTPKTAAGTRQTKALNKESEGPSGSGSRPAPVTVSFGGFSVPRPAKDGSDTPTLPTTVKKAITRDKVPSPWSPRPWDKDGGAVEKALVGVTRGSGPKRSRFAVENEEGVVGKRASEEQILDDEAEEEIPEEAALDFVPCSDGEEEEIEEEEGQENARENIDVEEPSKVHGKKAPTLTKRKAAEMEQVETKKTRATRRKAPLNALLDDTTTATTAATAAAEETTEEEAIQEGPKHGFISLTSVSAAIVDLCHSAVHRLRGLRLCVEGKEDGVVTHLVIGEERRTMKVMLAIANGAKLVTPEWLTASLEAGRWLPEGPYKPRMRFTAAADRARAQLDGSDGKERLLAQHAIHVSSGNGKAGPLKRVALALGASTAPLRNCSLCVVAGKGGERPAGLPRQVPAVTEEWLLNAAETYKIPDVKKYAVS